MEHTQTHTHNYIYAYAYTYTYTHTHTHTHLASSHVCTPVVGRGAVLGIALDHLLHQILSLATDLLSYSDLSCVLSDAIPARKE